MDNEQLISEQEEVLSDIATEKMRSVRIHEFGGPETLSYEETVIPPILPDEVLVKVQSAGVNPVDWKIREGFYEKDKINLPLTLGRDVSGIIERVGDMVPLFRKGDAVFACAASSRNGSYAEYIAVKVFELAIAPVRIPLKDAAGIPLAAQTAWVGLFEQGGLTKNQKVLIQGASGGVGTFAVQFAKIAGAWVIATTSARNLEMVTSLGADEVIDYESENFTEKLKDADLVFDTVGGEAQKKVWSVLRKGGSLVSTVGADQKAAADHGATGKSFVMISSGSRLQQIAALIDRGMVKVVIDKEFPLREAKEAQIHSKTGRAAGKIILRVK
jgi:NADPH:quinone reductase-like Zn-dependent oxidoreductase